MSLKTNLKYFSAFMAFIMMLGTAAGCDKAETSSVASGNGSDTSNVSFEDGFDGVVTSKFTLEGMREVSKTVGAVEGSDAEYAYKYKLVAGDFCLIENNIAKCKIVVAADAPSTVLAAANDLVLNLKNMTGAEIPIVEDNKETNGNVILVGSSKKTKELEIDIPSGFPENEGFRVISSKNVLVLAGNDDGSFTGTQYAVTYFLKSIGFGWYGPDELWQVVPTAATVIASECDITSTPSFQSRFTRVNNESPDIAKRWYLGGYNSEVDHKFGYMVPVNEYFADHPEYFAYSNGTRSTEGKRWWQLCLSNTDVQRIVANECIQFFEKNPNYVGVSIGQNDGDADPKSGDYANWCECEECKKFAPDFTQAMMKFANIIGRMIKDKCPGKTVMYYAYFPTYNAPDTTMKAEDNVLLMMCKQGGLTRFIRNNNMFNSNTGDIQFSQNYAAWKALGYKHIAIYEWNCPGAADVAWQDAFWVQGEVFLDNARWFKEQGVEFIFIDQGPNPSYERAIGYWELRWPLWYVNSIGMYNCELSFEEIMRPACDNLFGGASNYMYQFYKKLNDANKNCGSPNYYWGLPSVSEVYTQQYIAEIDLIMSDALTAARKIGGDVQKRVENQYENWLKTKAVA